MVPSLSGSRYLIAAGSPFYFLFRKSLIVFTFRFILIVLSGYGGNRMELTKEQAKEVRECLPSFDSINCSGCRFWIYCEETVLARDFGIYGDSREEQENGRRYEAEQIIDHGSETERECF